MINGWCLPSAREVGEARTHQHICATNKIHHHDAQDMWWRLFEACKTPGSSPLPSDVKIVWDQFDANGDGVLSKSESEEMLTFIFNQV